MSEQPERYATSAEQPSTPWVCPIRAGSQMRSPVAGDPLATVASCVRESCMLWERGQCSFRLIAKRLQYLSDITRHPSHLGGA